MNYNYQFNQSIVYVQGIEGAKAYPIAAGNVVILMDSEQPVFYRKSADYTGRPTLQIFDYKERVEKPSNEFVTRAEFEEFVSKITPVKEENEE